MRWPRWIKQRGGASSANSMRLPPPQQNKLRFLQRTERIHLNDITQHPPKDETGNVTRASIFQACFPRLYVAIRRDEDSRRRLAHRIDDSFMAERPRRENCWNKSAASPAEGKHMKNRLHTVKIAGGRAVSGAGRRFHSAKNRPLFQGEACKTASD